MHEVTMIVGIKSMKMNQTSQISCMLLGKIYLYFEHIHDMNMLLETVLFFLLLCFSIVMGDYYFLRNRGPKYTKGS